VYRIVVYPEAVDQIAALPAEALRAYAEALRAYADVLGALELTPWNGSPLHEDNPDGAVRCWDFGPGHAGQAIYLVLDERQEVHVVLVQWFG
jgi:hypothetical protein